MLFHEIYGTYYAIVTEILKRAAEEDLTEKDILELVRREGFTETVTVIPDALKSGRWPLLGGNYGSPEIPLSNLEKMWLKALLSDPRIQLFTDHLQELQKGLEDVEPLYEEGFFVLFDRYEDGDDYADKTYVRNFRIIRSAMREKKKIRITYGGRRGNRTHTLSPLKLEYSAKDDKFRLLGREDQKNITLNMASIRKVAMLDEGAVEADAYSGELCSVIFELKDERKAMERCMIGFSDLQKETEKLDDSNYRVTLHYYKEDETEILIRILSFGPLIKVTGPEQFLELVRGRVMKQK